MSSTSIVAFVKMVALSVLTMVLPPGLDGALEAILYCGLDTEFEDVMFLLPYSRLHELEADHLGLLIAAAACYRSPTGSKAFFDVVESLKESQARIVQASNKTNNKTHNKKDDKTDGNVKDEVRDDDYTATHPSSASRREQVARLAHKAEALLTESRCAHTRKDLERSARALQLSAMPSGWRKWSRV
jgi:Zn-dependent protease with chaperone function